MSDRLSRDLLSMLVENISGLDESCYSLEIIWESSRAVITFNKPADVEKFLTGSQCSQKLQKHGLTARPLEAAESVRVENLPLTVIKEMLELFFERSWTLPDNVVMIPDEHAAIATFNDAKVVESICHEQDYAMRSITFKVYPYYESMGTALYGKERPTWKMPEPFRESLHNVVWRFLREKKLFQSINDQMSSYFCSVNLDNADVILSPLPSLLRQKGLTAKHVDAWMSTAQEAFRQQMSQYSAFECKVNASAWKAAEEKVRSIVKEDAALVHDASRGILTVAGRGDDIKKVKGPVQNIVLKASLDEGAQKLTITGLPAEVYKTKSWILEPTVDTSKKQLNVPPSKSQSINDVNAFSSQVKETIHFGSCAVVQFIENKKKQEWFSIAKDNAVKVQFDSESTKITLTGDRLHVQKAKFCFHQLTSALSSHNFVVEKPGAKKYFLTQGSLFLSKIMTEYSCVVVLCPISQSQQYSASFGQVSSTSLSVYQMQMGQLTLEVSPGDITKEACDVIINSSNKDFSLRSGVSKAILDSAGITVEQECSRIVSSPTFQSDTFIHTSAGLLPSKNIIHIVGQKDPANIKEVVYSVLQYCEDNKLKSVAFPALGTGLGRVSPSDVADAMVDAVVDFVRKKQTRFVHSVKILIFQPVMMSLFHKSMKKREGQEVKEKSTLTTLEANATSYFMGLLDQRPSADHLVLESEEFEPAVFQLCADNDMAVKQAKKRIEELIVAEQSQNTITDQYISQLSRQDMDQLKALQRKLTVSIRLERGHEDQEPYIQLEGLTRDVYAAESAIRDIIRKVEGSENRKSKALMIKEHVEWQFDFRGTVVPFDDDTNLTLEEAREKKQPGVMIKINNEKYHADVMKLNAVSVKGHKQLELLRKELKADDAALPSHWDDMKGDLIKLFPVAARSQEYTDVETELRTSLAPNIIYQSRLGSGFRQRGKRDGGPAGGRSGVVADVALSGWAQPGSVASLDTRRSLKSPPWPGSRRRPQTFLPVLDYADDAALPSHWDAGSEEYTDVETELRNNGLTPNIISIERVQNTTLWKSYQLLKKQLEVKNKHNNNERKLFHATRAEYINLINKRGFHRSYAGTHGAMYGNGSYFAVSATYSQSQAKPDTRRHKRMYLAKVLVGDFTTGRAGVITPPTKSSSNATDLYDSVADNSANPTIFVVFNDIQAYPEYLITFT